ncbi:MAG: TOBE domain-containing protein, partial [Epsilonproteobacteria bacterium]|nr:TOBE domain-containing protein [Campylobacterota bacterium]
MLKEMNELSSKPILEKQTGGKGGGGTKLTPYAYELIEMYEKFSDLHRRFIDRFKEAGDDPEKLQTILNRTFLTTSARNQFLCNVTNIISNEVSSFITLVYKEKTIFRSTITTKSLQNMNISPSQNIYAIIKANDIKITASKGNGEENIIKGTISHINKNGLSCEIGLKTDDGFMLVALSNIDEISGLREGMEAYGIFKSENVLIGI